MTTHSMVIRELMETNPSVYNAVVRLMRSTDKIDALHFASPSKPVEARVTRNLERALSALSSARGIRAELKMTLDAVCEDIHHFEGKTIVDGLKASRKKEPQRAE